MSWDRLNKKKVNDIYEQVKNVKDGGGEVQRMGWKSLRCPVLNSLNWWLVAKISKKCHFQTDVHYQI